MSSLVVYVFLCSLYLHACTARPLGMVHHSKQNNPTLLVSPKDEKMVLTKRYSVNNNNNNNNNNNKEKASTYETLKKVDDQEHIRGENERSIIFSIGEFLLHKLQIKGTKEGRSALQISPSPPAAAAARVVFHDTAAGAMGKEEEVFSMDYTQPRRSPPIHNTRRP